MKNIRLRKYIQKINPSLHPFVIKFVEFHTDEF